MAGFNSEKAEGLHVDERDIKKHKNDVFRLFAIVSPESRISLPESVREDVNAFLSAMVTEQIDLRALGLPGVKMDDVFSSLRAIFFS